MPFSPLPAPSPIFLLALSQCLTVCLCLCVFWPLSVSAPHPYPCPSTLGSGTAPTSIVNVCFLEPGFKYLRNTVSSDPLCSLNVNVCYTSTITRDGVCALCQYQYIYQYISLIYIWEIKRENCERDFKVWKNLTFEYSMHN